MYKKILPISFHKKLLSRLKNKFKKVRILIKKIFLEKKAQDKLECSCHVTFLSIWF